MEDLAELLSSPFFLSPIIQILITFLLTSVLGAWLAKRHQHRNWLHQKDVSDREEERRVAETIFLEISQLMDRRLYRMRQVLWSLNRGDAARIAQKMEEYRQILYDWNDNNNKNLSRLEQYFGPEKRRHFEFRISRDFIFIGMLLEKWYQGNDSHSPFKVMFEKIDGLNALVYNFDKELLLAIQSNKVGRFRIETEKPAARAFRSFRSKVEALVSGLRKPKRLSDPPRSGPS